MQEILASMVACALCLSVSARAPGSNGVGAKATALQAGMKRMADLERVGRGGRPLVPPNPITRPANAWAVHYFAEFGRVLPNLAITESCSYAFGISAREVVR